MGLFQRKKKHPLFGGSIPPSCAYCQRGKAVTPETVLCRKKGVTTAGSSCGWFRYDPLKRVPPRPVTPDFSRFDDADFSL